MDRYKELRKLIAEDLKGQSYAKLGRALKINQGLINRVMHGGKSPTVLAAYADRLPPWDAAGVKQWKARIPQELFDTLSAEQERLGISRSDMLEITAQALSAIKEKL